MRRADFSNDMNLRFESSVNSRDSETSDFDTDDRISLRVV